MTKKLTFERFFWFHGRIKEKRYPNAMHLCEEFEIAERSAHRVIEFMRDRLNAPLEYNRVRRGYHYTDDQYELPGNWINESNVLSLALAVRLASTIPDRTIKDQLCRLIDKVVGPDCSTGRHLRLTRISEKISVKNIEYARVNEQFFQLTFQALLTDLPLRISYRSPHSGAVTERTIQPLHLLHYMGSWHLLAWCASRAAIRNFALSRLLRVEKSSDTLELPADLPPIKEYTRRHFGIIQGDETRQVTLRFSARLATRIQEQVWHPQAADHNRPRRQPPPQLPHRRFSRADQGCSRLWVGGAGGGPDGTAKFGERGNKKNEQNLFAMTLFGRVGVVWCEM